MKHIFLVFNLLVLAAVSGWSQDLQAAKEVVEVLTGGKTAVVSQEALTRPAFSAWETQVSADAQVYILADDILASELAAGRWTVTGESVSFNMELKAEEKLAVFSENTLDKLVTPFEIETKLPGFVRSFPIEWKNPLLNESPLSKILESAYGKEAIFFGTFVPSFSEVIALEIKPLTQPMSPLDALRKAVAEGLKIKTGFLVVAVQTPQMVLPEVLVLHLQQQRFISVPQSRFKGRQIDTLKRRLSNQAKQAAQEPAFDWRELSGNK